MTDQPLMICDIISHKDKTSKILSTTYCDIISIYLTIYAHFHFSSGASSRAWGFSLE